MKISKEETKPKKELKINVYTSNGTFGETQEESYGVEKNQNTIMDEKSLDEMNQEELKSIIKLQMRKIKVKYRNIK